MGGGRAAFVNRYGSGYAVPPTDPLASTGPGIFNNGGDAMRATPGRGLAPMPDIIPAGPWSGGALPYDAKANKDSIDYAIRAMQQDAPDIRALDLAASASRQQYIPHGRRIITVPNADPFPYGDHGGTERTGFLAPWEKDQMAAAQRNAPIQPFLDAGMKKSDIRQMMRTPQGMATLQEMQPEQWTPIPGTDYMQGRKGQTVPMRRAGEQVAVPPGMVPKSMTVGGVRYEVPEGDKPAGPLEIRAKLQPKEGFEMVQWSDGMILPSPRNISPTDKQKEDAYKAVTGQDLDKASPEHWSDAYYFARGERPPKWTQTAAAPAASPPAAKIREFATPEEAMKAGLKPGDRVMVGGRAATWK
jgi:hypothetical protein